MKPLAKEIIRYVSLYRKSVIFLVAVMMFSILTGTSVYNYFERTVVINDNGKPVTQKTMRYTVKEVLNQSGINLGPYDDINVDLNSTIQKKMINDIYIKRALPINIYADGKQQTIYSSRSTVYEAFQSSDLAFTMYDRIIGARLPDRLKDGMNLSIVRVSDKLIKQKEDVAYSTIKRESRELASGEEKVVRNGAEGIKEKTIRVIYENGKEIARQLVQECLLTPPQDRLIEYGNKYSHRVSRGGVIRSQKIMNMRCTAYTARYEDTGKSPGHPEFGITFTGQRVRKGMIAVDPRVIPLGSRVYVEIAGDTPDYGFAVAADTGGAIKGDLIDLYFDDGSTVDNWGCKKAKVYILDN